MVDAREKVFLFDVGRVLLKVSPVGPLLEHLPQFNNEEHFWSEWVLLDSVRQFETGKITESEFARAVTDELKTDLTADEFMFYFDRWPLGLYDEVEDVLAMIPANIKTATMSNMNERHWKLVMHSFQLDRLIDLHFPSFETGFMKPDRQAYDFVASKLACAKEKILFFDDNEINIQGALEAGFDAHRVVGINELKKAVASALKKLAR